MPAIWIFIIAMGVGLIIYPRFTIVAIIAPILGLTFGGFFWGLAAIFVPALISWGAFFLFVAIFTVVWGGTSTPRSDEENSHQFDGLCTGANFLEYSV